MCLLGLCGCLARYGVWTRGGMCWFLAILIECPQSVTRGEDATRGRECSTLICIKYAWGCRISASMKACVFQRENLPQQIRLIRAHTKGVMQPHASQKGS